MMSVRLALSIFCFLLIVAQAGAQPAEDKTWLAHYRNVEGYWQSEEGRLQALRDASSLGLLQYKTELESLGWEVDGMLDSLERLNLATKGSPLVKSLTQINNGFQVTGAMLSLSQLFNSIWYDDPALYQGAYIPEAAREPLKDMCFVLMSTTLSEDGTLYNLLGNTTISAATRQAFWVTQAVDLTLKAGNYLLVQPFFDTYERMWWETYRDYFLNGPGALSVGEWFALCQEGSNSQGFATTYRTHMAGFWENSNDREHFVE